MNTMHSTVQIRRFVLAGLLLLSASVTFGQLTLNIGTPAPPPLTIVNRTDSWRWHKGTNPPVGGWQTVADGALGALWLTGNGGFGYSTDTVGETNNCRTILTDMQNSYSTLYMRREFQITDAVDTNSVLRLTMDFDDAFVAYLDGAEIKRGGTFAGTVGTEPSNTTLATATHESSLGTSGNAPVVYDLGAVSNRLSVGTHYLAIIGINGTTRGSSDFIMVPDLSLASSVGGTAQNGTFLSIVSGSSVVLSGSNVVANSTRVTVNGDDAVMTSGNTAWAKTNNLAPGLNRVFIASLGTNGSLLASTNRVIISELSSTSVSGSLAGSNYWSSAMGIVRVTGSVTVPAGASLTIAPGTVVLLSSGAGITVSGTLTAIGTLTSPIFFGPATGSGEWGAISSAASGASVTLRRVESVGGRVSVVSGAAILIEDSVMHHFYGGSMLSGSGGNFTIRRSRLHHFHDSNINSGNVIAEDMLVEDCDSTDGDPFEMSNATGAQIRRFTLRRSTGNNADAFDCNSVNNVVFEDCLIHTVSDKGISIGTAGGPASQGVVIRNCLIYDTRTGIAFKDDSRASVSNVTIANSLYGIQLYPKYTTNTINAGGRVTNFYNNILWNNGTPITITNGTIFVNYSDISGTNWPGTNNLSVDPQFVNAAAGDYALSGSSPLLTAGADGTNMGFTSPVGGIPGTPLKFEAIVNGTNAVVLNWVDDADNEGGYVVERSTDGTNYFIAGTTGANGTSLTDSNGTPGVKYYYRVYASNPSGASDYSNVAAARRGGVVVISGGSVGGSITEDTLFAADGVFTVTSTLNVASGATLFIGSGAQMRFNAGTSLTVANGGRLMALGASNAPIQFTRSGASGSWGGVTINGAVGSPETHIEWANFAFNSQNPCIQVTAGTVFFDHLTFANPAAAYLHLDGASFVVQNCNFPKASGLEPVHGIGGIRSDGHGFIIRNFWGGTTGYNDLIDFTGGNRPGPIIHFIDNVFIGASDDMLDLDGTDAWVEHNIFMHAHKNGSPDTSSAVSSGPDSPNSSEITIIGNIMFDVDHAAMEKGPPPGFFALINNTIVHQTRSGGLDTDAAVVALADDGFTEDNGMYLEGNIIADAEKLMRFHTNSLVTYTNNIIATNGNWTTNLVWTGPGGNNSTNDPLFKTAIFDPAVPGGWTVNGSNLNVITSNMTTWAQAQVLWDWFSLQTNSPARGTGPNGLDKGGIIPIGASISGAPVGTTAQSNATLIVGINRTGNGIPIGNGFWPLGAGYTHYKWRLDGAAWSAETPIATPIVLSNLPNGPHYVEVTGKRDSAIYQDDPLNSIDAVLSRVNWTVGADTDGDGIPDDWELAHGLNPNNASDAALDPDGDGLSNLQEYLAGTDPQLASSTLKMEIAMLGTNALVTFDAASNKTYTVFLRDTFATNTPWQRLLDLPSAATNRSITLTNAPTQPAKFYRVVTPTAP